MLNIQTQVCNYSTGYAEYTETQVCNYSTGYAEYTETQVCNYSTGYAEYTETQTHICKKDMESDNIFTAIAEYMMWHCMVYCVLAVGCQYSSSVCFVRVVANKRNR